MFKKRAAGFKKIARDGKALEVPMVFTKIIRSYPFSINGKSKVPYNKMALEQCNAFYGAESSKCL